MKRQSRYVFALTFSFTIALLVGLSARGPKISASTANQAVDAAYRDGVFEAKLDFQNGRRPRLMSSRWNTDADRALFIAGYQRGYRELSEVYSKELARLSAAEVAGYWDGILDGARHRLASRAFQVDKTENFIRAGQGFREMSGDPEKYARYYRQAYANGYQQGYYGQQDR